MWEVAGSIIGQMMAQGKYDEIAKIRQEAMDRFGNTNLSTLESLAKEQLGPSKLGGVQMDQKYKGAQDEALDRLMGISKANGMDAQSLAKLNAAKQAAFGVERGMRGAADDSLARRGMMNSGAAISSAQGSAQAGVDRAYQGDISAASDASERALQALMSGGTMAENLGRSDLAQKNLAAGAEDRINEFNLGHRTQGEQNLVDTRLKIAGAQAGIGNLQAGDAAAAAEREQAMARGVGKAVGTGVNYATSSDSGDSDIDPLTGKKKVSTI